MSFYLDTSVVVSAFTTEARTIACQQWMRQNHAAPLAVSEWVSVEYSAAIAAKTKAQNFSETLRNEASAVYDRFLALGMLSFVVTSDDFSNAADLARRSLVGVRGADALHLAIASRRGATLCTLDKRQAEAGVALGLSTLLL